MKEDGEKVPSTFPIVKDYDIRLHTLPTNECQELASRFEEKVRKSLVGMMDAYDKLVYDVQSYLQWPKINFKDDHSISFSFFQELEDEYEIPRRRFKWKKWYLNMTFKNSWSSYRRIFLIIQLLSKNLWSTWRNSKNAILLSK